METLPPVILGAIISGAFVLIAVLRQPLVGYFVVKEPISSQPKRQFFLDLSLCLLAGMIAATFNTITFGFPAASAVSLIFGCAVAGFFLAIDMALNRERLIILDALARQPSQPAAARKTLPRHSQIFPGRRGHGPVRGADHHSGHLA